MQYQTTVRAGSGAEIPPRSLARPPPGLNDRTNPSPRLRFVFTTAEFRGKGSFLDRSMNITDYLKANKTVSDKGETSPSSAA